MKPRRPEGPKARRPEGPKARRRCAVLARPVHDMRVLLRWSKHRNQTAWVSVIEGWGDVNQIPKDSSRKK
jgi:hypothetical protein